MISVQCYISAEFRHPPHGDYNNVVTFRVSSEAMMEHFNEPRALLFNFYNDADFTMVLPHNVKTCKEGMHAIFATKDRIKNLNHDNLDPSEVKIVNYLNSNPDIPPNQLVPFNQNGDYIPMERTEITTHLLPKKLVREFYLLALYSERRNNIHKRINELRYGKIVTPLMNLPVVADDESIYDEGLSNEIEEIINSKFLKMKSEEPPTDIEEDNEAFFEMLRKNNII
jgi:hypothetical protein